MENVTYTKNQLADFSVKELKTLPLFAKIDPKGLDKAGIVNAMFKAQEEATEIEETNGKAEIKSEDAEANTDATTNLDNEADSEDDSNSDEDKEEGNENVQSEKSEKVVFHRNNNKRRNPMTFR